VVEKTNDSLSDELESLRRTLSEEMRNIREQLNDISKTVIEVSNLQKNDHALTVEHDKVLIRGNGTPSLLETVRTQATRLDLFITEMRDERNSRKQQEAETKKGVEAEVNKEKDRRKAEVNRWKWTGIGLGITFIPAFIYQSIVFWTKIAPLVESLPK
jgi:hypothetical protein